MLKELSLIIVSAAMAFSIDAEAKSLTSCSAFCSNSIAVKGGGQTMLMLVSGLSNTVEGAVQNMFNKCAPYSLSRGLFYNYISNGSASLEVHSTVTPSDFSANNMKARDFVSRACDTVIVD